MNAAATLTIRRRGDMAAKGSVDVGSCMERLVSVHSAPSQAVTGLGRRMAPIPPWLRLSPWEPAGTTSWRAPALFLVTRPLTCGVWGDESCFTWQPMAALGRVRKAQLRVPRMVAKDGAPLLRAGDGWQLVSVCGDVAASGTVMTDGIVNVEEVAGGALPVLPAATPLRLVCTGKGPCGRVRLLGDEPALDDVPLVTEWIVGTACASTMVGAFAPGRVECDPPPDSLGDTHQTHADWWVQPLLQFA